mmetsp:Transcript_32438/g.39261  ORF Transcript_32438/g.39261 Transcript_32438/m.39261 type:complete len:128 (+) Transcript_32438:111-494(+)|eukprot:CAMPEP_0197855238 /NCGR_PEP_ID=MMETSP1438-20131217/26228_1 /TAXON_ID=1461541 /ORGANISM="Pterosperma sp., Strain CCMP1384" /LENGTH=127 /DNA_ID=CAMNT_0043470271 /DNA_START=110 /DNA_END=493 /DNA_ORIENTATION=+
MAEKELKTFTMSDVEKHITTESCWMCIAGEVYDVTPYLDEHPGGGDIMLDSAGRDATNDFEDVGHSNMAKGTMAKFKIGTLEGYVPPEKKETTSGGGGFVFQLLIPIILAIVLFLVSNGTIQLGGSN